VPHLYSATVSDLPVALRPDLARRLTGALDRESKIVRGLDSLGPNAGRDVLLVDAEHSSIGEGLAALGARLVHAPLSKPLRLPVGDGSTDVVVSLWSAFRGIDASELAEVDRVLRPGGRLLVVHDYGRDDVSRLLGERPEQGAWSRRNGPFLSTGFRVRVIHCWWDFDSMDAATSFLSDAFGDPGAELGATLKRPRLSYKVAIYHRSRPAA
jgi:SAM-dependent methyltransferase